MSDPDCPECCCILKICCPPSGETAASSDPPKHTKALAAFISRKVRERGGTVSISAAAAMVVAEALTVEFDFAPAGTLDPFVQAVAAMARQHPTP